MVDDAGGLEANPVTRETERLRTFAKLTGEKGDLQAKLNSVKIQLNDLETELIEQFQGSGVQSVNIDGYTVYLRRSLFAGAAGGDKDTMHSVLQGLDDSWNFLVKDSVNSQSLSARIRELDVDEETGMPILPVELKGVIEIFEQFKVNARKSN